MWVTACLKGLSVLLILSGLSTEIPCHPSRSHGDHLLSHVLHTDSVTQCCFPRVTVRSVSITLHTAALSRPQVLFLEEDCHGLHAVSPKSKFRCYRIPLTCVLMMLPYEVYIKSYSEHVSLPFLQDGGHIHRYGKPWWTESQPSSSSRFSPCGSIPSPSTQWVNHMYMLLTLGSALMFPCLRVLHATFLDL